MRSRQQVLDFGPSEHFRALHGGHHYPVAVATKGAEFRQRLYRHEDAEAMLVELAGCDDLNVYLSQSGFQAAGDRGRSIRNVRALTSWWVDLDFYRLPHLAHLNASSLLDAVLTVLPWLPLPTFIIDSGRGAYFVWALDKPANVDRLPEWQLVEDVLVALMQSYGADAQARDAARILRVVGSLHLVAGERVSATRVGASVTFDAMRQLVIDNGGLQHLERLRERPAGPRLVPGVGNGKALSKRVGKGLQPYQLARDRVSDLCRLAELRGGRLQDQRKRMLFVFAVASAWFCGSVSQLRAECEDFAAQFFDGAERYPAHLVQSVVDRFIDDEHGKIVRLDWRLEPGRGRYKMTNRYICSLLGITDAEQRQLRTIISNGEKLRRLTDKRRASGMMSREQYRDRAAQRRQDALAMRAEGLSVRDVAERLGVSVGAAAGYLRG